MEIVIIKKDSQEWNNMLAKISSHPINEGYENPSLVINEGVSWKYIYSVRQGNKVIHDFIHLNHPKYSRTEYITFDASPSITDEDIEKVLPIK